MVSGSAKIKPISHAGAVGWLMLDFLVFHGSAGPKMNEKRREEFETPLPLELRKLPFFHEQSVIRCV